MKVFEMKKRASGMLSLLGYQDNINVIVLARLVVNFLHKPWNVRRSSSSTFKLSDFLNLFKEIIAINICTSFFYL